MPLDYFLWSYLKALIYTDRPFSFDALEDNIEAFIRGILAERLPYNQTSAKRENDKSVSAFVRGMGITQKKIVSIVF